MSKYRFSLIKLESRQEGTIDSESFSRAVEALGQQVSIRSGDVLEIGVTGFPPVRYECVGAIRPDQPIWMPAGALAA